MSKGVWEIVKTKVREVRVAEVEERRKTGRREKEAGREGIKKRQRKDEEKTQEEKNNRSEESGKRVGDLG